MRCVSKLAPKNGANRAVAVQFGALASVIVCTLLGTGCGGGSNANNASSSPTSSSGSANLTITANLPGATQGSSYAGSLTASGGTAPYDFVLVSGQLPQGVNLTDSTGAISGTPNATGNFSFGISVTDAKGESKQQSMQIAVAAAPAAPSTPPPSSPAPTPNPQPSPSPSPAPSPSPSPAPTGGGGNGTLSNLQASGGWSQYGQGPPDFVDCSPSPCNGIEFSMSQAVQNPSKSGNATVYWLGGSAPYSDALWNNHLIGQGSSQGLPDADQSLIPKLYNFTYDLDFYVDNANVAQALEFDINQFFGGMGFIFGHECRIAGGNQWDVFDNEKGQWVSTGLPCNPKSGEWNHLTLKVQRTSDNHLTYQSITLNGQTANLNWSLGHGTSGNWYGVTINFQLDGNYQQAPYKVYLDNVSLSYQ